MDSKVTRHSSLITSWSFQVCFYLVPRAFPMEIKNSIILGKSPGDEVDEDRRAGEFYVTIVYIRYSKMRKTDCINFSFINVHKRS